jgi:hypothetical protein
MSPLNGLAERMKSSGIEYEWRGELKDAVGAGSVAAAAQIHGVRKGTLSASLCDCREDLSHFADRHLLLGLRLIFYEGQFCQF